MSPVRFILPAAWLLAAAAPAAVPEPAGYWMNEAKGTVPATLAGTTVIDAPSLAKMLARGGVVLVDVAPASRRPPNQSPAMPWLPVPHHDIPGSLWIPGAGRGALPPDLAAYFLDRLARATGHDFNHPVVIYCHPNCWLSWNAAKRAISAGYRHVFWFRGGVEGWQEAGQPTAIAAAEGPDSQ